MELSVIICAHNPRLDYLGRVLAALQAQTLPLKQWELLLVDNASKEPLANVWDLSWHPSARHIVEATLGLVPARLRGIHTARANLLLFVDDDNLLAPDFAETLLRLAAEYPQLGCFGAGMLEPEFEEEPDRELHPYTNMLALRTVSDRLWSNCPPDHITPWGAGLAVIRSVALEYLNAANKRSIDRLGRCGTELNSCEDDEFSWIACRMGLGKGLFPELRLIHLIDRRRVQLDYFLRIAQGHAFSHAILDHLHGKKTEVPEDAPTFGAFLKALLSGNISDFFYHGQRWWISRRLPAIEKAMAKARLEGVRRAMQHIAAQDKAAEQA